MSRPLRLEYAGALYHLRHQGVTRGNSIVLAYASDVVIRKKRLETILDYTTPELAVLLKRQKARPDPSRLDPSRFTDQLCIMRPVNEAVKNLYLEKMGFSYDKKGNFCYRDVT